MMTQAMKAANLARALLQRLHSRSEAYALAVEILAALNQTEKCDKCEGRPVMGDEKIMSDSVTVIACGPHSAKCRCDCPESCGHKWDGPVVEFEEGRGGSVTCSICGMTAFAHDIWVMP